MINYRDDQLPVIILPYMANGDLKSFLRNQRNQTEMQHNKFPKGLNYTKLLYICLDIARGMEYLHKKKFVHRDLAARNCVIDSAFTTYVADFGLSRDVYSRDYYRMGLKAVKLPVKWMSPESLNDGLYDEKTDVWAFGVTCWEIFSLGRSPYPAIDNADMLEHIENGYRLKRPLLCEEPMYDIMLSCWMIDPEDRVTFSDIVKSICVLLRKSEDNSDEEGPSHDYFILEESSEILERRTKEIRNIS
jgi:serine/threonine protein kinase